MGLRVAEAVGTREAGLGTEWGVRHRRRPWLRPTQAPDTGPPQEVKLVNGFVSSA